MRKSIIAGLTLAVALTVFAGQAQSQAPTQGPAVELASLKHTTSHKPIRDVRRPQPSPAEVTGSTQFRIPAYPIVRDCVHVFFPQCGRGFDGLNDGTWGRY